MNVKKEMTRLESEIREENDETIYQGNFYLRSMTDIYTQFVLYII